MMAIFMASNACQSRRTPATAARGEFDQFMSAKGARSSATPEERERLFQEFLKWSSARERR